MIWLLKKIWGIYWYTIFIGIFLLWYPIIYITLSFPGLFKVANVIRIFWARLTFVLTILPWSIKYSEAYKKLRDDKTRTNGIVFTPNHSSYLDIPLFGLAIRGDFKFLAKKELAHIPIFGKFIRTIDIPVDRKNIKEGMKSLSKAADALDKKTNVCIFPEGTTNNNGKKLLAFKRGAFKLAVEKQVPIVPVTFLDNFRLFLNDGKHIGHPGRVRVIVHDPIETKGMTEKDVPELSKRVKEIIQAELNKHYEDR